VTIHFLRARKKKRRGGGKRGKVKPGLGFIFSPPSSKRKEGTRGKGIRRSVHFLSEKKKEGMARTAGSNRRNRCINSFKEKKRKRKGKTVLVSVVDVFFLFKDLLKRKKKRGKGERGRGSNAA